MAIKIETDSEPLIFTESEAIDEPEPEPKPEVAAEPEPTVVDEPEPEPEVAAVSESEPAVVNEPEPEIKKLTVETSTNLPAKLAMELASSTPAVRVPVSLRSSDAYDLLQILLEATSSQKFGFLVVQSTIAPVFIRKDLPRHVACVLFEAPSTAAGWSRKSVSPPPPWFSHDTSMLIP